MVTVPAKTEISLKTGTYLGQLEHYQDEVLGDISKGWKPLNNVTKISILDDAGILDTPLSK